MRKREKGWRLLRNLLILGSFLACIKLIFVDYTLDEEYQIVMAYRSLSGDTLFGTMWEPHQTSAFVCAALMRLFTAVWGGYTGVVVFLRCVTTLVQLFLTLWVYRILKKVTEREYAFLLGICYFNIVPKLIQIPEFSNLQLWSFTVIVLSLAEYRLKAVDGKRSRAGWLWIFVSGLGMSLSVLAYPADLLLFPVFLIVILFAGERRKVRGALLFAGTCAVCGGLFILAVLRRVSLDEMLRNVGYILKFDLTHDLSIGDGSRLTRILQGLGEEFLLFGAAFLIGVLIWLILRKSIPETMKRTPFLTGVAVPTALAAEGIQLVYWTVLGKGYEEPQIHLFAILCLAAAGWYYADERKYLLLPCLAGSLVLLLGVLYMSDLGFFYAIPHAMPGVLACALLLVFALENSFGKSTSRVWILVLLGSLAFVSIFGKGVTLRAGKTETNTVIGLGGIMKEGPAAGILTNYMQAYVNDCDYEDFEAYVDEGLNCLIVTNMVGTGGTTPYLFRDLSVSHFSIVDPTSYDERLLAYWELYPEKTPDVIVVDCWYGQLMEPEDSWIMQYIENDFGYSRSEDGRYVRFYFR